jgi:gentisate 1,2-dioxygenase
MTNPTPAQFSNAQDIEQLYRLLESVGVGPGWNKPEPSLWPRPKKNFLPAHFSYDIGRAALESAGRFVSTELAERRNLILYNPLPGNNYATARTIIAAYQMVKDHEAARSHRHTPNALRLVMEGGPKVYTVVDGKKIPMLPGDVLLTPNWSWHGHNNESDDCAYWIDFLDAPLVQLLEPMFLEPYAAAFVEKTETVDEKSPFRFAFSEVKSRLENAPEIQPGLRDVLLGPKKLETLDLHVMRLAGGGSFADTRATANSVFAVIEGEGTSVIDGREFHWRRGDVFVVPSWNTHTWRSHALSYLLRVTDEPVMKAFGWLRQEA